LEGRGKEKKLYNVGRVLRRRHWEDVSGGADYEALEVRFS